MYIHSLSSERKTKTLSKTKGNRKVNQAISFGGVWMISNDFAIEYLKEYENELKLLSKGVSFTELGIKERRESKRPTLLSRGILGGLSERAMTADNLTARGKQIAKIPIKGAMFAEDQLSSFGATTTANDIRIANASPNVDAIILEVNSGGGQKMAGALIQNAVNEATKPVVALVHNAGSAALMAILGADEIILSNETSGIGSIGVMTTIDKVMLNEELESFEDIYADVSSDKNKEFRALQQGDQGPMKEFLNNQAKIFQDQVKAGRNLNSDMSAETLRGGFFFGRDAIKRGLADKIGSLEKAASQAAYLSGRGKRKSNSNRRKTKSNTNMDLFAWVKNTFGKTVDSVEEAHEVITNSNLVPASKAEEVSEKANLELNNRITELEALVTKQGEMIDAQAALIASNAEASKVNLESLQNMKEGIESFVAESAADIETDIEEVKEENQALKLEFNKVKSKKSGAVVKGETEELTETETKVEEGFKIAFKPNIQTHTVVK